MSKAPEQIYLDGDVEAGDGIFPRCFESPKYASEPQVKYVRADLATPTHAEQLQQAFAMPEIVVLIDALYKSAEGWDNVIGMGLIPDEHFGSARVLRDEALEALQRVGVKP